MNKRRKLKNNSLSDKTLVYAAISAAVMLLMFTLLMTAFAAVMCQADIPFSFMPTIGTVLICISVFVSALVFSVMKGSAGLFSGGIIGLSSFVILFAVCTICRISPSSFAITKAFIMIASGAFGGFVGIVLSEKRRRIR